VIVSSPVLGVISADVNCQAAVPNVISQIVATDNCTPVNGLVITQNPVAGTLVGLGQNTITVTVTDASGNPTSRALNFSVADTTPPSVLAVPGPLTLGVSANCQVAAPNVLAAIVAADNCTPANQLILTQIPAAGSPLGLGHHEINVSITDASGNSATTNVSVTVVDSTAPSILSAPASVMISCHAAVPNVVPAIVAADNCTPANQLVIMQSPTAGSVVPAGQNMITVTVTDLYGNSATRDVALIVADTTAPTINSATATPNMLSPPNHQMVPLTISVSVSDSCDPAPTGKIIGVSCNETSDPRDVQITGDLTLNLAATRNPAGGGRVYTITIRCSDASGNNSDSMVTVTVPKGNDGKL